MSLDLLVAHPWRGCAHSSTIEFVVLAAMMVIELKIASNFLFSRGVFGWAANPHEDCADGGQRGASGLITYVIGIVEKI